MSRRAIGIALAVCVAWTAAGAAVLWPGGGDRDTAEDASAAADAGGAAVREPPPPDPSSGREGAAATGATAPAPAPSPAEQDSFALQRAEAPYALSPRLKHPPAVGLVFDVASGEVLWARRPERRLPIASLTKMMTALLIAERHAPREPVLISRKAPRVEGSRIGVLKAGRRVPLRGLLAGLLLASGNDAAAALAEHDAGTIAAFVGRMNARAAELGLGCTRFAGPAGLQDRGNRSCAYDLAALARASLAEPRIAAIIRRRGAEMPFPVKGGRLSLANNHYFVQRGIAGVPGATVTGVKTGYTNGAGRCYVTTARLRGAHLGVVLLDSPDPLRQVPALLRAGFASRGLAAEPARRPPEAGARRPAPPGSGASQPGVG